jgi:hypothetical protein
MRPACRCAATTTVTTMTLCRLLIPQTVQASAAVASSVRCWTSRNATHVTVPMRLLIEQLLAAAAAGWFSSSMASHCNAASSPGPSPGPASSAPLAPVAIASAKPAGGAEPLLAAAAAVRPPVPQPRRTVTDRRGSYSRAGQKRTATLAGQVEEHMRDITETALGGACAATCPFGKQCLHSVTRNELVQAHEFSFWDVAARPPKPL